MKIYHAIKEYVVYTFRLPVSFFMMILFPIILLTVLSTVFTGSFSNDVTFDHMDVEYSLESGNKYIDNSFKMYMNALEKNLDISFKESNDPALSQKKVADKEITAYINFTGVDKIQIYKNDSENLNSSILDFLITSYFERSNLYLSVLKFVPDFDFQKIEFFSDNFVKERSLLTKENLSSVDYYSITMILQMALYASLAAVFAILAQKKLDILKRVGLSGISVFKFMTGTIIGNMIVSSIQLFVIYLYSVLVLKANFGNNLMATFGIYLTLLFFSTAAGVSLGIVTDKESLAAVLPQIIIPFFAILGGAYFPVTFSISLISPIYWANRAINSIAFGGDSIYIYISLLVNIGIGLMFYLFSILKLRKVVYS